jgi:hypothetical protein
MADAIQLIEEEWTDCNGHQNWQVRATGSDGRMYSQVITKTPYGWPAVPSRDDARDAVRRAVATSQKQSHA